MNFCLRILFLLLLITATLTQDGFDLSDALGPDPTPEKPKQQPESPKQSGNDGGLDLSDAFGPDPTPAPKKPSSGDSGGFGFDLEDALKPGPTEKPKNPGYNPNGGGGGSFDDSDLMDVSKDGYKPDDGGRSGGRAMDPGYDDQDGAGKSQGGSGPLAGIISAVGVALVGAASSYFAYQKKKLCFKLQGGADPEKGQRGGQSNPGDSQLFSNLLRNN
ncbi:CD99 molecule [Poecilia formosa]|uniref:CD99 molecule n=1 Tax=Poecilia formosa TaxID=48698 RepID=A0A087X8Z8_POEFO|nr:PREDICTED: CD99 antigen-like protein 2 [Poecilia formosa]